jgi:hypothetical protein
MPAASFVFRAAASAVRFAIDPPLTNNAWFASLWRGTAMAGDPASQESFFT